MVVELVMVMIMVVMVMMMIVIIGPRVCQKCARACKEYGDE